MKPARTLAALALAALAAGPALAFDIGHPPTDPAQDRAKAVAELVVGPAPAGFAPLIPPASGLFVHAASFDGSLTRDPRTTAIAFQARLVVDAQPLEPGLFLGTGSPFDAQPPNDAGDSGHALPGSRQDALAEVVNGGLWSYDAQRLTIEFTPAPGTESLKLRWVFGTEEFREYVGSSYNDVFAMFLFREGETGPVGGQFWSAPPGFRELADAGSTYFLTDDQVDWLAQHQIAYDAQGAPITVNGPFFSGSAVVEPPANELEYDGATRVLETVAPLQQSVRYTLYIVIADTDDQIYDSGVFIASLAGRTERVNEPGTTISPAGGGSTGGGTTSGGGSSSGGATTGGGSTTGGATAAGGGTSSGGTVGVPPIGGGPTTGGGSTTGGAVIGTSKSGGGSGGCRAGGRGDPRGLAPVVAALAIAAMNRRARFRRRGA